MRNLTLPVAALLAGCLLLAGAATVTAAADGPSAASSIDENGTDANESAEAGICMIGVDSPCNGEQWDGDDGPGSVPADGERITTPDENENGDGERIGESDGTESTEAGICVIGADSPCNGEQWDGDEGRTDESTESGTAIGDGGHGESGSDAGICVIGADSPCNDDRWEPLSSMVDALLRSVPMV